jgi:hypothetical protein
LTRVKVALFVLYVLLTGVQTINGQQMQAQPEAKRVKQIQTALVQHGYQPGKTWAETQTVLRSIAEEKGWQTHFAPDARVLIILGLGNKNSDVEYVENNGHNHLDGAPKSRAMHVKQP